MKAHRMAGISTSLSLAIFGFCNPAFATVDNAVTVTVSEVVTEDLAPEVHSAGTVFSRNESLITAGLAGRLIWVAEPGDFIKQGEAVARFDCDYLTLQRDEQMAQADREQADVDSLTREVDRLDEARKLLVASVTQFETVKANRDRAAGNLRIAQVRISQIENQLGRCVAAAPFDGVVTERRQRASEDIERSTVIAAMTDTQNLEVRASLPVRYLPRVETGGAAFIRMSEIRFETQIRKIVPAADPMSQTFEVRIQLPEGAPSFVAAGQLVSIRLPLSSKHALTVPRDSIVLKEEGSFVIRIKSDSTAEQVSVEVADANGDRVSVRGDLSVGDRVAVRGAEGLADGELVAVLQES
jgi:RND family efflux transporter MFP subunit